MRNLPYSRHWGWGKVSDRQEEGSLPGWRRLQQSKWFFSSSLLPLLSLELFSVPGHLGSNPPPGEPWILYPLVHTGQHECLLVRWEVVCPVRTPPSSGVTREMSPDWYSVTYKEFDKCFNQDTISDFRWWGLCTWENLHLRFKRK